jgi:hypothetical protein
MALTMDSMKTSLSAKSKLQLMRDMFTGIDTRMAVVMRRSETVRGLGKTVLVKAS